MAELACGVMRAHHTKNKGDLGVLHAQVDLAEKGYAILLPQTEHAPFDLVAYRDGRFVRVQVKYRAAVNGAVAVPLMSAWADRHGTHMVPIDKTSIDVLCVYCPQTKACYYVDPGTVNRSFLLRLDAPRNSQVKGVRFAKDFTEIPESVTGVPAGSRPGLEGDRELGQSFAPRRP